MLPPARPQDSESESDRCDHLSGSVASFNRGNRPSLVANQPNFTTFSSSWRGPSAFQLQVGDPIRSQQTRVTVGPRQFVCPVTCICTCP